MSYMLTDLGSKLDVAISDTATYPSTISIVWKSERIHQSHVGLKQITEILQGRLQDMQDCQQSSQQPEAHIGK